MGRHARRSSDLRGSSQRHQAWHAHKRRSQNDSLAKADQVYITGEASSHCVKATTEHIVSNFDQGSLSKLVLLTDCMSPVTGFDGQYDSFVRDMRARGLQIATAADVLPELMANGLR